MCDSRIAVVGATGAVGLEVLAILASRGVEGSRVVALASTNSEGVEVAHGRSSVRVRALSESALAQCAWAIFCADAETSRRFAPVAVRAGMTVVDNSSAFRMDEDVPLVVPEINGDLLDEACGPRVIANPNCSTIIMLMGLEPLRRKFGAVEIVVSTYQAVSGAGLAGMRELDEQTRAFAEGRTIEPRVFPHPCAFNVFAHESAMDPATGVNGEEAKMIAETRKIWCDDSIAVVPTCVRVPVRRAHSQSILVTLDRAASEAEVREALAGMVGVRVVDDRRAGRFPTPLEASGLDDVLVGRVRLVGAREVQGKARRVALWVCGDQLRKGAALNAVQIVERLERTRISAGCLSGSPRVGALGGALFWN